MKFEYRLTEPGWAAVTISHEGVEATITASYLGDALGDLLRAVIEIMEGREEVVSTWLEEPGEFRWIFHQTDGIVNLEVVDFGDRPLGSVVFSGEVPISELGTAVAETAQRVLAELGTDGYKERWIEDDFPQSELTRLGALLGSDGN